VSALFIISLALLLGSTILLLVSLRLPREVRRFPVGIAAVLIIGACSIIISQRLQLGTSGIVIQWVFTIALVVALAVNVRLVTAFHRQTSGLRARAGGE
jgi:hypothetical protein